jgi:hypothetical protein
MSSRAEQKAMSLGGAKNLGSNRNAEGTRQVTNRERVQHQVVEAHGATKVDYTPDQHTRKHEQGVFESKGESGKREMKKSGATLGRHVTSKLQSPDRRFRRIVRNSSVPFGLNVRRKRSVVEEQIGAARRELSASQFRLNLLKYLKQPVSRSRPSSSRRACRTILLFSNSASKFPTKSDA